MPYQIIVKDIAGNIKLDITSDCFLGAYHEISQGIDKQMIISGFSYCDCDGKTLINVLNTAEEVQSELTNKMLMQAGVKPFEQKQPSIHVVNPDDLK